LIHNLQERFDLPLQRTPSTATQDDKRWVDQVNYLRDQVLGVLAMNTLHDNTDLQLGFPQEFRDSISDVLNRPFPLLLEPRLAPKRGRW
jgi:hypothetical protein